tara:strand:+ start:360 stop:1964 length:1605 start_codon:yes stop_codon:yes gene_type:complete
MYKKASFFGLLSIVALTILTSYPNIPSEKGRDSLLYHSFATLVISEGQIFWLSELISAFGWTSVGQEIGIVSFLSSLSIITGISVSYTILFMAMALKFQLIFAAFCLSKFLGLRSPFILPVLILTSLYVIRHTEWVISPRFMTICLSTNLFLCISILIDKLDSRLYYIRFTGLALVLFFVMLLTHKMYILILTILFFLAFSIFGLKKVRPIVGSKVILAFISIITLVSVYNPPDFWLNYYSADQPTLSFGPLYLEDNFADNILKILIRLSLFFGILSPLCLHGIYIIQKEVSMRSNFLFSFLICLSPTLTEGIYFMHIYSIPIFALIAISLNEMFKTQNLKKLAVLLIASSLLQIGFVYASTPEEEGIHNLGGSSYILGDTSDMSHYTLVNLEGFYISNSKEGLQVSTINPSRIKISYMHEKPLLLTPPDNIQDVFLEYEWDVSEDVGVSTYEISTLIWNRPITDQENIILFNNLNVKYAIINVNFHETVKPETTVRYSKDVENYSQKSILLEDINKSFYKVYENDYNKVIVFN